MATPQQAAICRVTVIAGGVLQATTRLGSIRLGLDLQAEARFFRLNDAAVVRPGASLSLVALFSP